MQGPGSGEGGRVGWGLSKGGEGGGAGVGGVPVPAVQLLHAGGALSRMLQGGKGGPHI